GAGGSSSATAMPVSNGEAAAAASFRAAEPVGPEPVDPDLRRVSDSNGEKAGCAGCGATDEATAPARAASLLPTLRGAAGRGGAEAGGAAAGEAARAGDTEERCGLAPPPGSWLINCSSGMSRCV